MGIQTDQKEQQKKNKLYINIAWNNCPVCFRIILYIKMISSIQITTYEVYI